MLLTEIEVLRILSWFALGSTVAAVVVTSLPMAFANGSRPAVRGMIALSLIQVIVSMFMVFITHNLDSINSTGMAEVGVYVLRLAPTASAAWLISVGVHYWRIRHKH